MSKIIQLSDGETKNLLHEKREKRSEPARKGESRRRGSSPPGEEDDDFVMPRRRISLTAFFDALYRLRSVPSDTDFSQPRSRPFPSTDRAAPAPDKTSEYVEQDFEREGALHEVAPGAETLSNQPYIALSGSDWDYLNQVMLGRLQAGSEDVLDPTGFSQVNGSSREVGNSAQIYYDLAVQLAQPHFVVGGTEYKFSAHFGHDWVEREAKESDATERWNPFNLAGGSGGAERTKSIAQGQLEIKVEASARGPLVYEVVNPPAPPLSPGGLEAAHYEAFETSDTATFKITGEPRFSAERVEFSFGGKDNRVYLRAKLTGIELYTTSGEYVSRAHWVRPRRGRVFIDAEDPVLRTSRFYQSNAGQHVREIKLYPERLGAKSLVAIIAQGKKTFYIWRVTAVAG
ncbi:MAG: hypothetical protein WBP93_09455 [Pyrinomonadaceae bacterium]